MASSGIFSRRAMVDTSTRYAWDQRLEDQFFVRHLPLLGYRVAPARVARHFSAESAWRDGLRPVGTHKPHAHLGAGELRALLATHLHTHPPTT